MTPNNKYFDLIVAKDFEITENDKPVKRTQWNRVGKAWHSKNSDRLLVELFMFPGQLYVLAPQEQKEKVTPFEEMEF